ncbi:hypothetical protein B0H15DRAFT_547139 [Mycena belliarum]|uniref:Uncharacterized protein n=1 Tax=Mycena belliarum TaxID=1033014 RepID=A0AAD6XS54_9AGAR|nr:hypothetical protein B0H15DRAFT_547139 [Mycena belliae]
MSSASSSTASLVSSTTVSSRTPLNAAKPKDFSAAFAQLQSTYGFGATAPTPVQRKPSTPPSGPSVSSPVPTAPASGQQKDYQAAFARLQSSHGFAGSAPVPVQKSESRKNGGTSLFSKLTRTSESTKSKSRSPSPSTFLTKQESPPRPAAHRAHDRVVVALVP